MSGYHPDPEINAEVAAEAVRVEMLDVSLGYSPRWWRCPNCGATHRRGWFLAFGQHRCLGCGYVGAEGTMHTNRPPTRSD
jgi:rubredoxin